MLVIESLTFLDAGERRKVLREVLDSLEANGLTIGAGITKVWAPTQKLRFEIAFNKAIDREMLLGALGGLPISVRKFHIVYR